MILRKALDDVGLPEVQFSTRVVADQAEAEAVGFAGSPTILIDGCDPFAASTGTAGLACRLYRDDAGLSGTPPLAPLRQALKRAAEHR
ncbi:hypothetical protein [Salinispora fenicalii]|uniref:hypothetical protein n=1 Tax=Salinispora fenicalii TaxID=1137263 RepID=UPI00165F820E|nr:hypothetical protein [Salinispora fenicalii]